ncbi:DUF4362 domain-containing protein [Rossellomorea aquimaris]|uniref:DUF4362 domain-containing protein n=1 Tax=Rossellomorea aquimaris TaxID=189382 RepID=UPI001CD71C32|nr:DUF4362 domain-containing protein [Rossellomorea aquimaris]MCA1055888.1 DUF4362 domain-containing protein [Rossellomorea aquimaris]
MKKWMTTGLLLALLIGGCDESGGGLDHEVSQKIGDYEPKETDVVNTHGKVENLERFKEFYEHVSNGKKDRVRVVFYTDEGDPILHDIRFDGKEFKSVMDTRRDKFGQGEIKDFTCSNIKYTNGEMADNVYRLVDCGSDDEAIILWY